MNFVGLEVLADGPARSLQMYLDHRMDDFDERGVRRSLNRLWERTVIRRSTAFIHGTLVWCLTDDEREYDWDRYHRKRRRHERTTAAATRRRGDASVRHALCRWPHPAQP